MTAGGGSLPLRSSSSLEVLGVVSGLDSAIVKRIAMKVIDFDIVGRQ